MFYKITQWKKLSSRFIVFVKVNGRVINQSINKPFHANSLDVASGKPIMARPIVRWQLAHRCLWHHRKM